MSTGEIKKNDADHLFAFFVKSRTDFECCTNSKNVNIRSHLKLHEVTNANERSLSTIQAGCGKIAFPQHRVD
jgi:hypothetical protein